MKWYEGNPTKDRVFSDNIAIGTSALAVLTTGSGNIAIGDYALSKLQHENNQIQIGRFRVWRWLAPLIAPFIRPHARRFAEWIIRTAYYPA